ncbi:hypothetical protein BH10PSE1_BH10PSE1_11010 [soil metagenome]
MPLDDLATDGWMKQCILITPSAEYEQWLVAIQSATKLAGKEMVLHHGLELDRGAGFDRCVFVSTNKKFLEPSADAEVCVIATGLSGAINKTEELTGGSGLYAVIDTGALVVEALTYPGARVITDATIRSAPVPVLLLHDLSVEPPSITRQHPSSDLERAGQQALSLFENGPPLVGATTEFMPEIFFIETRKRELRPRETLLDVTGGPRLLVNGPQITLTPGLWQATIRFSVDEDSARYGFRFEWGSMEDVTAVNITPKASGVFDLTIQHPFVQAARSEMRVHLTEGALHGEFEFLGVRVVKIAEATPATVLAN